MAHENGTQLTAQWRAYVEILKSENEGLSHKIHQITDSIDQDSHHAQGLQLRVTALEQETSQLASSLSASRSSYARICAEHRRVKAELRQSLEEKEAAWASYTRLRELFACQAKMTPEVDISDIGSLRECIATLVMSLQQKEAELGRARQVLEKQMAQNRRLKGDILQQDAATTLASMAASESELSTGLSPLSEPIKEWLSPSLSIASL